MTADVGSIEIARMFIGAAVDIEAKDNHRENLLFGACRKGVDMVKVLLDSGANIVPKAKSMKHPYSRHALRVRILSRYY